MTSRGGADCDDPCHLSWYFCRKTAALKNGRTHHPCLRKNRGRLLWCPWDVTDIPLPAERQPHLCFKTTSIGATDTMRRNRPLCQQRTSLCRFPPYACIAPSGFKGGLKLSKEWIVCTADIRNRIHEAGIFRPDERIVLTAKNCVLLEHFTGKAYSYRMVDLHTLKAKRLFSRSTPLNEAGYRRAIEKMATQSESGTAFVQDEVRGPGNYLPISSMTFCRSTD